MFCGSFVLAAVIAGLASVQPAMGAPTTSPSCPITNATFDDIKVTDPASPTTLVGTYRGLTFQGFYVDSFSRSSLTGVLSESGTQRAVFGLTSQLEQGGAIQISVPASSKIKVFNLLSTAYGCVAATQENLVAAPAACNITLTAFGTAGKQVAAQTVTFEPNGVLSHMDVAKFDSKKKFANLVKLVVTFTPLVESAVVAGLIDDFAFTNCTA